MMSRMDHDPELRVTLPDESILRELETCSSCIEFIARACELYRPRPALGARNAQGNYQTLSYGELWDRANALASGWFHEDMVRAHETVGILGFASPDFVVVEWACLLTGAIAAPLQAHMPTADLIHCIQEAKLRCLVCSVEILEHVLTVLPDCPLVSRIMVMDLKGDEEGLFPHRTLKIQTLAALEDLGRKRGAVPRVEPEPGQDPLMKILYTSGSTGHPKGAMLPESLLLAKWRKCVQPPYQLDSPVVWFNFAPLNHLAGSNILMRSLARGSLLYFTSKSDMSNLFEDIRLARPTHMFLIPRISNLIYQHFQMEVMRLATLHCGMSKDTLEDQAMLEMRQSFLGDRLIELRTGSAPTAPEVLDFLRRCFDVPVYNTYGSTEADVITVNDRIVRPHVVDYKLADVPELGYSRDDRPYPRGELRVKVQHAIAGYFQHDSSPDQLFDEQGYLMTGDIFEEQAPDHIVWVDRKKNIVKLSQGEFVSLWRLESLYTGGHGLIDQIYLYASGFRSYMLAVVVPNREAMLAHASVESLKKALRTEIQTIAAEAGLHAYEIPRDFIIERERFSKENGLLTESSKQHPGRLKQKYQKRLNQLYDELERKQLQNAVLEPESWSDLSIEARIKKALTAVLGVEEPFERSFRDFGGDSLSAVRLSTMLEQLTSVSVPVSQILNPSSRLQDLIPYVKRMKEGKGPPGSQTYARIHGLNPQKLRADDLRLDRFLSREEWKAADQQKRVDPSLTPKCVLLTGANGFLGRFLILELLEQLPEDSTIVCLVRAADEATAVERLLDAWTSGEESLRSSFSRLLEQKRIVALAGDLMQADFGLKHELWQEFSQTVDAVVHNGALVNHAFSYEQLFEPNVLGTVEAIRFALHGRHKAFTFISSVAVASFGSQTERVMESAKAQDLCREWSLESHYAAGYAATKWAGEILLEDLQKQFSIPVNIVRCGMILAHTRWPGHINVSDYFSRLLCGLVMTGIAPQTFYQDPEATHNQHFDGIPVDFVARSLAALAIHPQPGYSIFHMVNDHVGGASLDLIADWIQTAGYPLERISDYKTWYQNFGALLNSLDHVSRQSSPLPILYQWQQPLTAKGRVRLDASRLRRRLLELGLPADVPLLDETYMHQCLAGLRWHGVIHEPQHSAYQRTGDRP